jgi:glycosyltransferase involved in cell wall biosynthesis
VTRVEYNVAREAVLLGAKLVRFDEALQAFVAAELPTNFGGSRNEVELLLKETPTVRAPFLQRRALRKARALRKFLAGRAAAASDTEIDAARGELAWLLAYNYEFLPVPERFELASHAHALEPQALCHKFNYWITIERGKRAFPGGLSAAEPVHLRPGDKLISLGAVWNQDYIGYLERLTSQGVSVVALIYDMIPITHPGFLPADELERFKTYLDRMLKSDMILTTISRSSQEEIASYARESLGFLREVAVTPLASSVSAQRLKASDQILDAGLHDQPFVFMAGSFEPRKNQKFLLDIWRTVVPRLLNPPALVFAGGLAKATYLQELQRAARDLERVLFFYNVDDEELAWFYQNCVFTIFPSEAEGWGLPITEALDHGKYCLASDNTSLREAGQGLVFHAALQNREAWIDELRTVLSNPLALGERTERVRENHRSRSWADVTRAMMAL